MTVLTAITLKNYRAFHGEYRLSIPKDKKNVLLYGENGSGKTSLFRALYDCFHTTSLSPINFTPHVQQLASEEGFISLEFEDNRTFRFSATATDSLEELVEQASFFSYIDLLKTHFPQRKAEPWEYDRDINPNPNLFDIIIDMLKEVKLSSGATIAEDWENIRVVLASEKRSSRRYKENKVKMESFRTNLTAVLTEFMGVMNRLLGLFRQNITITGFRLNFEQGNWVGKQWYYVRRELYLTISFNGKPTIHYQNLLNEARLSAIGLCLYLSSLILAPNTENGYKILFLDDIFVGLDTSNRLPLLKILQEFEVERDMFDTTGNYVLAENGERRKERYKPFDAYQIFLTTYDRYWFEIAQHYLAKNKWTSIELYAHSDEALEFEIPLIQPSEDYYKKAEFYFKRNKGYKDYPAAANYLRKACEKELKRLLFGKYGLMNGPEGSTQTREQLDQLKQGLEALITDFGLDKEPFKNFDIIVKTTLNPLSHDNLQKPIYKRELEDAFQLFKDLRNITTVSIFLKKDTVIHLQTDKEGLRRVTVLQLTEDVWSLKQGENKKHSRIGVKPLYYMENDTKKDLSKEKEYAIDKAYDRVYHTVFGKEKASESKDILIEFRDESGKSLKDILSI